jgi:hypothetical protein
MQVSVIVVVSGSIAVILTTVGSMMAVTVSGTEVVTVLVTIVG